MLCDVNRVIKAVQVSLFRAQILTQTFIEYSSYVKLPKVRKCDHNFAMLKSVLMFSIGLVSQCVLSLNVSAMPYSGAAPKFKGLRFIFELSTYIF